MFFGSYEYTIDGKGRLVIPSKFRNQVGDNLYLTKGMDGCLSICTEESFEKQLTAFKNLAFEKSKVRAYQRLFLESVVNLTIDTQGRVLIPTKTLKQYGIGSKVNILGVIDRFEIWDMEAWIKYQNENEKDYEADAESILTDEN
ncbi:MAG TPA: division/cell wall cluster transcriptional repressor MraZ [Candidatus Onthovivens sp.]|nr:division/cell wall cluster transcriptional repressor MraZ [Candidatus Onthovivens sp.]